MSNGKIKIEDLPSEVIEKLGLDIEGIPAVAGRLKIMSSVMKLLSGLTSRDALWTLRKVINLIEGERDKIAREKTIKETIDK